MIFTRDTVRGPNMLTANMTSPATRYALSLEGRVGMSSTEKTAKIANLHSLNYAKLHTPVQPRGTGLKSDVEAAQAGIVRC